MEQFSLFGINKQFIQAEFVTLPYETKLIHNLMSAGYIGVDSRYTPIKAAEQ